jgi:hypothetical protein
MDAYWYTRIHYLVGVWRGFLLSPPQPPETWVAPIYSMHHLLNFISGSTVIAKIMHEFINLVIPCLSLDVEPVVSLSKPPFRAWIYVIVVHLHTGEKCLFALTPTDAT